MGKRVQVILKDHEHREIQRMSVAEWARQALDLARRESGAGKELEVIRAAAWHDFPSADIGSMLAEIESGYGTGPHP